MQKDPKLFRNPVVTFSFIFLLILALLAILAPLVTPYTYYEQSATQALQGPSSLHWMGTDTLGRDLFSRILFGARISLALGICTSVLALFFGLLVGCLSGFKGGWIDTLLMRLVDLFYIFPAPLMAILFTLILGREFFGICAALTLTSWMTQARLVRAQVLQAREQSYVEAARALGVSPFRILTRHILPNIAGPLIASLTLQIPTNMMHESFLSFIGLGLQPPLSSWGTLAQEGFRAMQSYPHLTLFPSIILFTTLLAFQSVGNGVWEMIDPHNRMTVK